MLENQRMQLKLDTFPTGPFLEIYITESMCVDRNNPAPSASQPHLFNKNWSRKAQLTHYRFAAAWLYIKPTYMQKHISQPTGDPVDSDSDIPVTQELHRRSDPPWA